MEIKPLENLEYFAKRNNIPELEYAFSIDSGFAGPVVLIVGSLHGREPAGSEAILTLSKYLEVNDLKPKKGKIILAIGNPEAYKLQTRLINENLNRSFRENLSENIEGRRAAQFREFFNKNQIEAVLDLHSMVLGDLQMAAYLKSEANKLFALAISPVSFHLAADHNCLPGSLMEEAARFGAKSLAVECGNNNDPNSVNIALLHIKKLLVYYELFELEALASLVYNSADINLNNQINSQKIKLYETIQPIVPSPEFRFTVTNLGNETFVKEGEVYAISSSFEYIAPKDSYIILPDPKPNPNDSDAGFLCSLEILENQIV